MLEKTPEVGSIHGNRLVVVDEIRDPRQLPTVARLLRQNQTVAVASHLNAAWFWPFRLAGPCRHYSTDRDCAKIGHHLSRRGISHTAAAVTAQVTLIWTASLRGIPAEASTKPFICHRSWIA